MTWILSAHWALVASVWYLGNGILHDAFVIIKHKGKYDRELMRLLMDGHILILSGVLVFIGWLMMLNKIQWGSLISLILAVFMLLYCAMIFPFLKSIGTIFISFMLSVVCTNALLNFSNFYYSMPSH